MSFIFSVGRLELEAFIHIRKKILKCLNMLTGTIDGFQGVEIGNIKTGGGLQEIRLGLWKLDTLRVVYVHEAPQA